MNGLKVFTHHEFGQVRTVIKDGSPWFVAADVCRALKIINNRDALNRLDEDEKGVAKIDTPGWKTAGWRSRSGPSITRTAACA